MLRFLIYILIPVILGSLMGSCSAPDIVVDNRNSKDFKPVAILDEWKYYSGNSNEGLHTQIPEWPDSCRSLVLPHRLLLPNTPMWYKCRILTTDSSVIKVSADDGAQVFFDGRYVPAFSPRHHQLWPVSDSAELYIRVLNNAMKGGLRKVELFPQELCEVMREEHRAALKALEHRQHPDSLEIIAGPLFGLKDGSSGQVRVQVSGTEEVELLYSINGVQWQSSGKKAGDGRKVYTFDLPVHGEGIPVEYFFRQGALESPVYQLDYNTDDRLLRFSAWGDSQGGWETFSQLVSDMEGRDLGFTIGLGDLVANGSDPRQWLDWHRSLQPLGSRIPVYPVPGNHDYDGCYDELIPELYHQFARDSHYFSWTWGNAAFIALDPNEDFPIGIRGQQEDWLKAQFASPEWNKARWRFILLHQPPYSQSWEGYHGDDFIREIIDANAESKAIDFVLSGHSHCFEKLTKAYGNQNTHFVILGGGGGNLEDTNFSSYPVMDTIIIRHHYGLFELNDNAADLTLIGIEGDTLFHENFNK